VDLLCLGWNCVIGSGIFISQGEIGKAVGPYGPGLFLLGGVLCMPIALCFGELARQFPGMGGSALFAREAFGARWGVVVGWVMWLSGLIGGASVAVGFATFLGSSHPQAVAVGLVLLLACINLVGTLGGAWSNNLLALLKLGPLALAAALGLFWVGPSGILSPPSEVPIPLNWMAGLLAVLYAYSGFEEISLPAGEVKDSQRNVPRATLAVLASSALLYTLLQGLVTHQGTWTSTRPLQAAFQERLPWLAQGLGLAALVSLASVNASIAFTTPRSLWTLAQHGWLPAALLKLKRGAPSLCIMISSSLTLGLILSQSLQRLLMLSVLASLLQHLSSSLACWKLRGWASRPGTPHLAVGVCLLLLLTSDPSLLRGMGLSLILGGLITVILRAR